YATKDYSHFDLQNSTRTESSRAEIPPSAPPPSTDHTTKNYSYYDLQNNTVTKSSRRENPHSTSRRSIHYATRDYSQSDLENSTVTESKAEIPPLTSPSSTGCVQFYSIFHMSKYGCRF
ncbi:hypothetical protein scyTo_0023820, partial [Scyliorhinus torazame]|nr:hypothetical protein [Scyliorhinus torazame]